VYFLEIFKLRPNCPNVNNRIAASTCKNVALLYAVESPNPALVRVWMLKDRLLLLLRPDINGTVLAGGYKLLLIDASDSIDSIIVAFKDNLCLFFGLPNNVLVVIPRSNKITLVYAVNIDYISVMPVISFNNASLSSIPLLNSAIAAD
jgi:hypothetical protein